MGANVSNSCLSWLRSGQLLEGIYNRNVFLKKNRLANMRELRPIALYNVIYKMVDKILSNRICLVLSDIIDDTQSTFIVGNLIIDNIIMATKVQWLKDDRKGLHGVVALR